jgi:hypothetical protein
LRHLTLGVAGDELSLVEAARTQANLVHGHGNEQERFGVYVTFQLQGGLGSQVAEQTGSDLDALILEQMDELAQGSRVGSEADGAGEGWQLDGALRAAGIAVAGFFTLEKVSTEGAARHGEWLNGSEAGVTDWKAGKSKERGVAEAAIGGKQGRKQAPYRIARYSGRQRSSCRHAVPATAEDWPPLETPGAAEAA